jgi:leucyl-tRNA synthetase
MSPSPQAGPMQATGLGYPWADVEARWQLAWRSQASFATPTLRPGEHGVHIFAAAPFTSGHAHMGHVRSYTIADAYARFMRATGEPLLFTMGFDAFGLPAELAAITAGVHPKVWVERCAAAMREQFDAMGFSFDWERTFISSEEDMYRWSQWLFLLLFEHDMVYQKDGRVDWCPSCKTVLARSQVQEGQCWRCSSEVTLAARRQWFLRASAYVAECSEQLAGLAGWDNNSLGSQTSVLGRVKGFELDASTLDGRTLCVFLLREDSVSNAAYIGISPGHPDLEQWLPDVWVKEAVDALRTGGWVRSDRKAEEVVFVETTLQAVVPGVPRMLPVVVAPYIESRYGPTAILGVPEEDPTAAVIAGVIADRGASTVRVGAQAAKLREAVRFSAADFPVSRQRGWGTPIPLVNCNHCGTVPVSREDLPVALPDDVRFTGTANPLADDANFLTCACPRCGGPAEREAETLDCHFDALWIWIPACVPQSLRSTEMFDHAQVQCWLPVQQIIWGLDGGAYILSQRTTAKMLRDAGYLEYVPEGEPFVRALMHGMVKHEGRKMSKHLGNVVDPSELMKRVGADTVRLAILYAAAPRNGTNWTEKDIDFCHRFLKRLWSYATDARLEITSSGVSPVDVTSPHRRRIAKWCDTATQKIGRDLRDLQMHRAVRNAMLLLDRIEDFEQRVGRGGLDELDQAAIRAALRLLAQLMAPLTPHIAEELWARLGGNGLISAAPWPEGLAVATGEARERETGA